MKYYAVTEDPNELLHYGVKGMKWGQHIFGDKPKSAGYHRALGKLRAAVQKSSTQRAINRQQKQQEKYNRAVQKAQFRINAIENMSAANRLTNYERRLNQQYKEERKNNKAAMKLEKQYAANDRKMNKYMQQARQGKLHYGKLSEDQVKQITDRLALERSARSLGSAEKTWRQQKKEAFRKGKLSGIEKGTAAAMEEVARAGTVYGIQNFMNRKKLNAAAKQQGKQEHIKNVERNKKTNKEIRDDIKQEAYESEIRSGKGFWQRTELGRHMSAGRAATLIKENENKKLEEDRKRRLEARINDEIDMGNNEKYQKLLADQREKKRIQDVQDRLSNDTDEKWQRHLDSTGMTDAEARKRAGFDDDSIASASKEEAARQRRIALSKNEKTEKEAAYNKLAEEAKRRIANEEKEERNKKLEEDYSKAMEKYSEDKAYDKQLKEEYKEKVKEYEVAYRKWENNQEFGDGEMKKPEPVKKPNYRNPKKPEEPKYEKLDNTPKLLPSYSDYVTLRDLGINVSDVISGKNNNNGGNGKKKNKK